jgi:hypothetical protein
MKEVSVAVNTIKPISRQMSIVVVDRCRIVSDFFTD